MTTRRAFLRGFLGLVAAAALPVGALLDQVRRISAPGFDGGFADRWKADMEEELLFHRVITYSSCWGMVLIRPEEPGDIIDVRAATTREAEARIEEWQRVAWEEDRHISNVCVSRDLYAKFVEESRRHPRPLGMPRRMDGTGVLAGLAT